MTVSSDELRHPSPPAISPKQMNILRAVTAMAWADGVLEPQEVEVMSAKLSQAFAAQPEAQAQLAVQIRDYFDQNIPIEEVLPSITDAGDRQLILKLGYLTIAASARTEDEPLVNMQEMVAFQRLAQLLDLPESTIRAVSEEAAAEGHQSDTDPLEALVTGFTEHYTGG